MNKPRSNHSSIVFKNRIFVFGDTMDNSIEAWEGVKWKLMPQKLSGPTMNLGLFNRLDENILIIGGGGPALGMSKSVLFYVENR